MTIDLHARRFVWLAVLAGLMIRGAAMLQSHGTFDDPDNYLPLARAVASGEGFCLNGRPTAYRPPLYPLMLVPAISIPGVDPAYGIAALHLALGAGTIWLTALAARHLGLSPGRCLAAALIVAFDPVLVGQSRAVMTETPTAFFMAAALAALGGRGWTGQVLGGLSMGLASLCRPSMLVGAGLTVVCACLVKPGDWTTRLGRSALVAIATVLVLLPWAIRNDLVFGEPVWTTTHGGYTLALANNPVYYDDVLRGPPGRVWTGHDQWLWWDSVNRATRGMTEPQADRYLRYSVWQLARDRPIDFARSVVARLAHFWSPAPAASVYSGPVRNPDDGLDSASLAVRSGGSGPP